MCALHLTEYGLSEGKDQLRQTSVAQDMPNDNDKMIFQRNVQLGTMKDVLKKQANRTYRDQTNYKDMAKCRKVCKDAQGSSILS